MNSSDQGDDSQPKCNASGKSDRGPTAWSKETFSCVFGRLCHPDAPHWFIAAFTLGLLVFAACAWQESRRTTQALQDQLEVLRTEQRPWLTGGVVVDSDLSIIGPNLSLGVTFTLTNSGRSPALNVRVVPNLHAQMASYKLETSAISAMCEKMKKSSGGYMVVPGIDDKQHFTLQIPWEQTFGEAPVFNRARGIPTSDVFLFIFGCVYYENQTTKEPHQTPFRYGIRIDDPLHRETTGVRIESPFVKRENIVLFREGIGDIPVY